MLVTNLLHVVLPWFFVIWEIHVLWCLPFILFSSFVTGKISLAEGGIKSGALAFKVVDDKTFIDCSTRHCNWDVPASKASVALFCYQWINTGHYALSISLLNHVSRFPSIYRHLNVIKNLPQSVLVYVDSNLIRPR